MRITRLTPIVASDPVRVMAMSRDHAGMKRFFAQEGVAYLARSRFHNRRARHAARTIARQYKKLSKTPSGSDIGYQRSIIGLRVAAGFSSPCVLSGRIADICICRLSETLGYGVFARTVIPAGTLVGAYVGMIIERGDFDGETKYVFESNPWHAFFKAQFPDRHPRLLVDAGPAGNEMRYINHIDSNLWVRSARNNRGRAYVSAANVRVCTYFLRGAFHTALSTVRDVAAGEELRYDYGENYWSNQADTRDNSFVYRVANGKLVEVPTEV